MLSCGAALNHCVVAFALGWQSKIHRFPNAAPNHLAAIELHRYPATEVDVTLAAAIPRRRTDRRYYSSWPVPQGDIALVAARAARAGVMSRRIDALANLRCLVSQAAWRHGNDYDYLRELATCTGRYARRPVRPRVTPRNPIQRHRYRPGRSPARSSLKRRTRTPPTTMLSWLRLVPSTMTRCAAARR